MTTKPKPLVSFAWVVVRELPNGEELLLMNEVSATKAGCEKAVADAAEFSPRWNADTPVKRIVWCEAEFKPVGKV